MGKFSIVTNVSSKTINVMAEGFFTIQEGTAFVEEYKKNVQKINSGEYNLIVDASKQSVTDKDVQALLQEAFSLYASSGFKKVTIKTGGNSILKMQCSRIAAQVGLKADIQ